MKNEFYQSKINPLPTVSLVLAVSLIGASTAVAAKSHSIIDSSSGDNPALREGIERCAHSYYSEATDAGDQITRVEVLRCFAENLLRETKDSPQGLIDILNRHFWELL